jgi:invasion protein IalB
LLKVRHKGARRWGRVASLIIAVLALSAAAESVGAADAEVRAFRDWALRCPPDGSCLLEQRIFVEGDREPLMHLSLQYAGPSRELMAAVRVPLGVLLPQGLALAVDDDAPRKVPFHHCRKEGCFAIFPMPDRLAARFRSGLRATLTVDLVEGKSVSVPASLLGVTAGLRALRERRSGGNP